MRGPARSAYVVRSEMPFPGNLSLSVETGRLQPRHAGNGHRASKAHRNARTARARMQVRTRACGHGRAVQSLVARALAAKLVESSDGNACRNFRGPASIRKACRETSKAINPGKRANQCLHLSAEKREGAIQHARPLLHILARIRRRRGGNRVRRSD
jgi:hypothetical protein